MIQARRFGDEVYVTSDDVAEAHRALDGARPMSVRAYGMACPGLGRVTRLENPIPRLQIWGVAGDVTETDGGRLWTADRFRMLQLSSIRGEGRGETSQAAAMFARAREALGRNGFTWRHAARTWIYLARILDWYGEFNRIRREHFQAAGVGPAFPASTGIQGRSGDGEECQMDLLAVENVPVRFIHKTPRQNEPFNYGSAFSRGAVIQRNGHRTVHVSGTASIDGEGRTVHADDPVAQAKETLGNVEALLGDEGGGLETVVSSTLFCRDADVLRTCLRALEPLPFPVVPVVAHVCRPDLFVELEAVAVIQGKSPCRSS